jgi:hypothetical protein
MEYYNYHLKLETISRWVREGRLSEREGLLLRGSPSTPGFRGRFQESITWLETFSPGVGKRFRPNKGWQRNTKPMREALIAAQIQGRVRKAPGFTNPPSKDRRTARAKSTGERCKQWGHPWPDGTRCRTCRWHGAMGAPYGKLAWREELRYDSSTGQFRKVKVRVRKREPRES